MKPRDKTIFNRERMRKDASYFPHQYKCKECNNKYGSNSKRENKICPLCMAEYKSRKKKK